MMLILERYLACHLWVELVKLISHFAYSKKVKDTAQGKLLLFYSLPTLCSLSQSLCDPLSSSITHTPAANREANRPVARGGSGGSDEPPVVAVKKILSFTAPAVTEAVL